MPQGPHSRTGLCLTWSSGDKRRGSLVQAQLSTQQGAPLTPLAHTNPKPPTPNQFATPACSCPEAAEACAQDILAEDSGHLGPPLPPKASCLQKAAGNRGKTQKSPSYTCSTPPCQGLCPPAHTSVHRYGPHPQPWDLSESRDPVALQVQGSQDSTNFTHSYCYSEGPLDCGTLVCSYAMGPSTEVQSCSSSLILLSPLPPPSPPPLPCPPPSSSGDILRAPRSSKIRSSRNVAQHQCFTARSPEPCTAGLCWAAWDFQTHCPVSPAGWTPHPGRRCGSPT